MRTTRFTSTKLQSSGKKGILKPDADGYYELIVGGLNAYNSSGEFYTLESACQLFESSSILMRRISKGALKSELGHPKIKPGMTNDQFLQRILTLEETNISGHFSEIWLDHQYGKKNPQCGNPELVAIMAKVRPSGPHGPALEASLNNPKENVSFSVRGLTDNYYQKGKCIRVLTTIVTFDQVVEQGIPQANKWDAPALESLSEQIVTEDSLRRIVEDRSPIAVESTRELANQALQAVRLSELPKIPLWSKW